MVFRYRPFAIFGLALLFGTGSAQANDVELAFQITTMLRSARAVVAEDKAFIVDPVAVRGNTSPDDFVNGFIDKAREKYQQEIGSPLPAEGGTAVGQAGAHLLDAIRRVVKRAVTGGYQDQFVWSEHKYFKKGTSAYDGQFLPARFSVEVSLAFNQNTGGKHLLRITAPERYLVNKRHAPDEWEEKAMQAVFWTSSPIAGYVSKQLKYKGQPAFRQLIPEKYEPSCLGCHGNGRGQNGANIHQSGVGGALGDIGGAISFISFK